MNTLTWSRTTADRSSACDPSVRVASRSGGPWETGCVLVRHYEFAEPAIVRAAYRGDSEIPGRDMLLEGRFFGLRFYLGVRITGIIDETRDADGGRERVWGWSYPDARGSPGAGTPQL
jgi:hypothetical protein